MADPPRLTWDTIEGLSPRERELGEILLPGADLLTVSLRGASVNGERLPDIRFGRVLRESESER